MIDATKAQKWDEFVKESVEKNPWSLPYKLASEKAKVAEIASSIETENESTLSWEETAERIIKDLFPEDNEEEDTERQKGIRQENRRYGHAANGRTESFTEEELLEVISQMKKGKAPGIDGIDLIIIQKAYPIIKNHLLAILNGCLKYGLFPQEWKVGKLVIFSKSKDKDPTKSGSYRPICLLPVLGKILEALMAKRLKVLIEQQMDDTQYGFRKGRSTEDAIYRLREIVRGSQSKYVLAILLDIKNAFNTVWWPSILKELREIGCPGDMYRLVQSYLQDRKIVRQEGNNRIEKKMTRGCPQGSVLGPIFWILIFNVVLRALRNRQIKSVNYADDEVTVIEGDSRYELEEKGQSAIDIIVEKLDELKITHSPDKCTIMMASKASFHQKCYPSIHIHGQRLKRMEPCKYLGVTFGKSLTTSDHVDRLCRKTKEFFDRLARIVKSKWGLGYKSLRTVYKGVFVPIITYAAAAWFDKTNKPQKIKLIMAQRYALMKISGAYRTTSAESLTTIYGTLPIDLECERAAACYKVRKGIEAKIYDLTILPRDQNLDNDNIGKKYFEKEAKRRIWKEVVRQWQIRWTESDKGRTTYKYLPDIEERLKMYWFKPDKWMIQVLSGHGTFNTFRKKCKFREDDLCICGIQDDNEHAIKICGRFYYIRRLYTEIMRYGRVDIRSWLRRRDKCEALMDLAKDILEIKQKADILERRRNER